MINQETDVKRSIIYFMQGALNAAELEPVTEHFDGGHLELVDYLLTIAEPVALTIEKYYWPTFEDDWGGPVDYEVTENVGHIFISEWSRQINMGSGGASAPSLDDVAEMLAVQMSKFLNKTSLPVKPLILPEKSEPSTKKLTAEEREMSLIYFIMGAKEHPEYEAVEALTCEIYDVVRELRDVGLVALTELETKYLTQFSFEVSVDFCFEIMEPMGYDYIQTYITTNKKPATAWPKNQLEWRLARWPNLKDFTEETAKQTASPEFNPVNLGRSPKPLAPETMTPDVHHELTVQYFMAGATKVMGFQEFVDSLGIGDYEFMSILLREAKKCESLIHEKYIERYQFLSYSETAYNVTEPLGREYIYELSKRRNDLPIVELEPEWLENKIDELVLELLEHHCKNTNLDFGAFELAHRLESMLSSEVPEPIQSVLRKRFPAIVSLLGVEK